MNFQVFSILIEHCNFDLRAREQYILIESEAASHQTLILITTLLHHSHAVSQIIAEQYYLEEAQHTFRNIRTANAKCINDKACDLISCNSVGHTFSIYYVGYFRKAYSHYDRFHLFLHWIFVWVVVLWIFNLQKLRAI